MQVEIGNDDEIGMGIDMPAGNMDDDFEEIADQMEQNLEREIGDGDHAVVAPVERKGEKVMEVTTGTEWTPGVLTTNNEFSYFDPKSVRNWAGPEHWKFKAPAKKGILTYITQLTFLCSCFGWRGRN